MPWHPLVSFRTDPDEPVTVTYYRPRAHRPDPRTLGRPVQVDVRTVFPVLPDGFDWAPCRPILSIVRQDPAAPGQDEILARAAMVRAIVAWGAVA